MNGGRSETDENGFNYRVPVAVKPVNVASDYYYYDPSSLGTTNSATVSEILGSSEGWLASPCVNCNAIHARFLVRIAYSSFVGAGGLAYSDGSVYSPAYGLRPLINLSSTLQITGQDASGAWTIE